jgi:3-oxoacyl-[acyl-carrier protein] reductase
MYWRERSKTTGGQVYARVISTASESFLFGTPGQPNYAAAKAGIVSLTMGTAKVLLKYGGTANVVMPRARTRMSHRGPFAAMFDAPAEGFDNMNPRTVRRCSPISRARPRRTSPRSCSSSGASRWW